MENIQVRIRDARKKLGWPQARLAKELGISREAVSFWENGKNHPDSERIGDLARVLKVSADWLWTGRGRPKATIPDPPIVGHVGAGAEVYPIDDHEPGAGLDIAELPPGETETVVALIVRGESMQPVYRDGDLLYYRRDGGLNAGELQGRECVVKLVDGRMLVKMLRRAGRKNIFDLISYNAPPIEGVRLEWAAPVRWVRRA